MRGWPGVLVAAAVLSLGAAGAAADGGARGGGAWDRGGPAPNRGGAAMPAGGHGRDGACELAAADRATTPSARCVACHADSPGTAIDFRMTPGGSSGMAHPVEVDYASVALRQPDRYVPPALLPREIALVHGKVACTSCHDGASPDPKRVANVSQLCESCHRL